MLRDGAGLSEAPASTCLTTAAWGRDLIGAAVLVAGALGAVDVGGGSASQGYRDELAASKARVDTLKQELEHAEQLHEALEERARK